MRADVLNLSERELLRGSILTFTSRRIDSRLKLLTSSNEQVNASAYFAVDLSSRNGQISTIRLKAPGVLVFEHSFNETREKVVVVVTGSGNRLEVTMTQGQSLVAPTSLLDKLRTIPALTWQQALSAAMKKVPRQFLTQNIVGISTTVAVCAVAIAPVCIGSSGKLASSFAVELAIAVLKELKIQMVLTHTEETLLVKVIKDAKLLYSVLSVNSIVDVAKVISEVSTTEPSENTEVIMQIAGDSADKFTILISIAKGKNR
jgi:hypothetical protein